MIGYTIIRKARLKHTYIQIKADTTVEIRTNLTTSSKKIEELVAQKSEWIRKKQKLLHEKEVLPEDSFYLFGEVSLKKDYAITSHASLDKFYRQKAIETITPLIEIWSEKMQLFPTHVGFRKAKTRWGSCSGQDRLSFNINLAKMHPEFIEYVVVHELAHIKHKNHSKAFWREVENYLPDYKRRKKLII